MKFGMTASLTSSSQESMTDYLSTKNVELFDRYGYGRVMPLPDLSAKQETLLTRFGVSLKEGAPDSYWRVASIILRTEAEFAVT